MGTGHNAGSEKAFEHLYNRYELDERKPCQNQWKAITECFGLYKSAAARSLWILTEDMRGARKEPGGIDRPSANYEVVQTVNSAWQKIAKKVHFFPPTDHTLPKFRHFFGKIQNAFCQKSGKISARIQKPRPPHVKHDSRSKRRNRKKMQKKHVFWGICSPKICAPSPILIGIVI